MGKGNLKMETMANDVIDRALVKKEKQLSDLHLATKYLLPLL